MDVYKKYIRNMSGIYSEYAGNMEGTWRGCVTEQAWEDKFGKICMKGMTKGGVRCFDCSAYWQS